MNDIEKKMEALKADFLEKLEALEKEAEMQKKQEEPKPWKPEARAEYFFIDNYFLSHSFYNMNDDVDSYNFEIGNCFPTKERAEQVAKKMRLLLRLEQMHDRFCPNFEHDWGDFGAEEFSVVFDHADGKMKPLTDFGDGENPTAYFDSYETACYVADILNAEMEKENEKADC